LLLDLLTWRLLLDNNIKAVAQAVLVEVLELLTRPQNYLTPRLLT
jgi:hypothetical protein